MKAYVTSGERDAPDVFVVRQSTLLEVPVFMEPNRARRAAWCRTDESFLTKINRFELPRGIVVVDAVSGFEPDLADSTRSREGRLSRPTV